MKRKLFSKKNYISMTISSYILAEFSLNILTHPRGIYKILRFYHTIHLTSSKLISLNGKCVHSHFIYFFICLPIDVRTKRKFRTEKIKTLPSINHCHLIFFCRFKTCLAFYLWSNKK